MLYVTHDQEEAMTLGDRIAVLSEGELMQVAPPLEVYQAPANLFVAGFIGSPAMNILSAERLPALDRPAGPTVRLGIRPQDAEVVDPAEGDLAGPVDVVEPLGSDVLAHVTLGGTDVEPFRVLAPADLGLTAGRPVGLRVRRDRLHRFDARSGRRLA